MPAITIMDFGRTVREIPVVTRNLLIINILIYLLELLTGTRFTNWMDDHLGLHLIGSSKFNPVQIFTYMFLHGGFVHILFNMFTLWMFGRILEQVWGSRRFFVFYMICGMGAALVQEGVWALTWYHDYVSAIAPLNGLTFEHASELVNAAIANHDTGVLGGIDSYKSSLVTIGASGAIYGLLLGFAFVFPNMPLYLFFIPVPIKAKYMVIGYAVIEFMLGVGSSAGTIAHFAHLGGMIFGLILLLYWRHKGTLNGNNFY